MLAEILRENFECFRGFQTAELNNIMDFCDHVEMPKGEVLWMEGCRENYAAFILKGKIGIKKQTDFSERHVFIGVYAAGSVVGELCLLTDQPRTVCAVVLESAEMVVLHSNKFEKLIQNHPLVGLQLLKHIFLSTSKRLTKSYERIASMF